MLNQNKNKGFSLVELIIAISVLSIGILGILQAFPKGIKTQTIIQDNSVANNLAQEKLEKLAGITYEDIGYGVLENKIRMDTDQTGDLYKFQRTTTVEYINSNFETSQTDLGLKKITVKIEWPSALDGSTESIEIKTIASKR